jgi:hypothetical protein
MADPYQLDENFLNTAKGRQLLSRSLQMYGQQPDVTALNEYAAQRQQQARMSMLNSLAAQYAGKGFEPMQGALLKRSMEAYAPEKFGDYGMVANGRFIADPYASRDKQAAAMTRLGENVYGAESDEAKQKAADARAAARDAAMDARAAAREDALFKRQEAALKARDEIEARKQEAIDASNREAARQRASTADIVIGKVDEALNSVGLTTTGLIGKKAADSIPGSEAYALDRTLDTIRANLGFEQLSAMRAASPTGGALGQVTERELALLQSTVASLDIGLSASVLRQNLEQVKKHYANIKSLMDGKLPPEYQQNSGAGGQAGGSPPPGAVRRRGQ